MRILVLSKRQYTGRDLIDDRFGRIRELPIALAEAGHQVAGVCLSYRPRDERVHDDVKANIRVNWHSLNAHRLIPFSTGNYGLTVGAVVNALRPDVIWACSDAFHAILGVQFAKKFRAALVVDLYDNFESFTATRFPLIKTAFRRALRRADGITCVSQPLVRYVRKISRYKGPIEVIENAVPTGVFRPRNQKMCRREFGLPSKGIFIGTAGAISRSRDIDTLFNAFQILAQRSSNIHLVLAGPCDKGISLPQNTHVHYVGDLSPEKVPTLLSTLDVSIICNRDSAFGKYCFPQKFYESLACEIPTVAAAIGAMRELLHSYPAHLYEPQNAESLAVAVMGMIDHPVLLPFKVPTWKSLGHRLEDFLQRCVR